MHTAAAWNIAEGLLRDEHLRHELMRKLAEFNASEAYTNERFDKVRGLARHLTICEHAGVAVTEKRR